MEILLRKSIFACLMETAYSCSTSPFLISPIPARNKFTSVAKETGEVWGLRMQDHNDICCLIPWKFASTTWRGTHRGTRVNKTRDHRFHRFTAVSQPGEWKRMLSSPLHHSQQHDHRVTSSLTGSLTGGTMNFRGALTIAFSASPSTFTLHVRLYRSSQPGTCF